MMSSTEKIMDSISDDQRDESETINADGRSDEEVPEEKLGYPKSIGFIISNEFCERFNYYGMRTILVLYLTRKLDYDDDTATVLFHVFTSLVYFFPLIGAVVADSFLGKFKTILYLSIVYAIGSVVISVGAIPTLNLPAKEVTVIGLVLIAIGTGGIKPCVSAFGGDQFKIPQQAKQLATFFSLFYFAINAGSLISTYLTPVLRQDVHCFGQNDCFSLAFGVPGVLMVVSIFIFMFGRLFYVVKKPSGNMIVLVSKCICNALKTRTAEKATNPKEHWLDYAEAKYGKQIIADIRSLGKILVLYLPLPFFWALFDQQGSRWTFQATRMTGEIGSFTLKPDQMQVVNPLLILLFIPLFDYFVYPLLAKIGISRPLQKLTLGGLLAALAFGISGLVELQLEKTYPVLPSAAESQLRIFNGMPCTYNFETDIPEHLTFALKSLELFEQKHVAVNNNKTFTYKMTSTNSECPQKTGTFYVESGNSMSFFIKQTLAPTKDVTLVEYKESVQKSKNGDPNLRVLSNFASLQDVLLKGQDRDYKFASNSTDLVNMFPSNYEILVNKKKLGNIEVKLGGVYTLVVNNGETLKTHIITEPNSVHMLWLIPQFVVITAGEIMFSVTGLEFSFTQAPTSMKSVLQACWLLTVAIGNMIVVGIAEAKFFHSQALEFFLFAVLMVIDMGLFMILAYRYKYVETAEDENEEPNKLNGVDKREMSGPVKNGVQNEGYQDDTINV